MEDKIRYKEILLPSEEPFLSYSVGESKSLEPLSLVNIFIGSNNCGKSRLIRSLFYLKFFRYKTNKYDATDCHNLLKELDRDFQLVFTNTRPNVTVVGDISITYIEEKLQAQDRDFIDCNNPIYKVIEDILQTLINITETTAKKEELYAYPIRFIGESSKKEFDKLNIDLKLGSERRYYIPSLRGMRPLLEDQNISCKSRIKKEHNVYENRTKKDYFGKDTLLENMKIFTGLELYQTLKEKLLGEPDERKQVRKFEEFLSENFFENKEVTLIPREKEPKVVHIKIGEEPQFPIYNLGDGLQNLIICTFNIFMEKERCLFFMEEPDMFMHPSMQRAFLEVLSKVDRHQYFITSHSNHFLDMTIDFANISVFHFSKHEDTQPQFHIRPSSPRDREILLDLGVRNSSVFITNATIWVEGKTDRLYLKAYMKKYIDELEYSDPKKYSELIKLKEDYHYSFVEYQGANLTHWSFEPDEKETKEIKASYVCAHAFLIADGDVATKGDRKQIYTDMLGDRFYLLEVKEIENLLPVEVLREIVANKFENHQVDINSIDYKKYSKPKIPLGEYLDSLLPQPLERAVFAEKSGTIKAKGTFCDSAVKFIQDTKWSLKNYRKIKILCEKIFNHIITQNKNS
ncbi:AAA family ATPase [Pseudanabaena sp. BC1403]|uniref:AAA family ATPase n=1 Tax=Pseudanabaena sp. BC1403 TaxID=2043171 RepID=UPI000CD9CA4D|nr:AAA family ATPase [Pseudanabaena sp. BC1403]